MPKYQVHIDTDKGEFHVKKDGEQMEHDHMCMGSYSMADDNYQTDQNVGDDYNAMVSQASKKKRIYLSHSHTNENGVKSTYDHAFYLGTPEQPNTMMSPNYGVPQSISNSCISEEVIKIVENKVAIAKLNAVLCKKSK